MLSCRSMYKFFKWSVVGPGEESLDPPFPPLPLSLLLPVIGGNFSKYSLLAFQGAIIREEGGKSGKWPVSWYEGGERGLDQRSLVVHAAAEESVIKVNSAAAKKIKWPSVQFPGSNTVRGKKKTSGSCFCRYCLSRFLHFSFFVPNQTRWREDGEAALWLLFIASSGHDIFTCMKEENGSWNCP